MSAVVDARSIPSPLTRATHAQGMAAYQREGLRRAREIGNFGPVRLDAHGRLHSDILAAYWKHGF